MLIIFLFMLNCVCAKENPEVLIANGKIQGTYAYSTNQRLYAAFEGIPYAKPPIGDLRFEKPQPVESWTDVLIANKLVECAQFPLTYESTSSVIGTEDCLHINVYTPNTDPTAKLDVIVHIHGGGFMFGTGHAFGPKHLMDSNVVYVNFNYRLNILGFLSTENDIVPGNNGMKDQVLALKWIKNNIHNFGGNPNSITLTGFSAGGASVHLHYMSPLSKGLFNHGISQSGTAYNPWVMSEGNLEKAIKLASNLRCKTKDIKKMVACLKQVPVVDLVNQVGNFLEFLYAPFSPFGVVIENKSDDAFLTESPRSAVKNGRSANLPWLLSVTENEGLWPSAEYLRNPGVMWYIGSKWNNLAPFILDYNYTANQSIHRKLGEKIKQKYFQDSKIDRFTFNNFVEMMSDRHFKVDAFNAALDQSRYTKSPVYFYNFNYRGQHSLVEILINTTDNLGISHGDDCAYLIPGVVTPYSPKDETMKDFMIGIWTTFAKTGYPMAPGINKWPTVGKDEKVLTYLSINGPNKSIVEKSKKFGNADFWNHLSIND